MSRPGESDRADGSVGKVRFRPWRLDLPFLWGQGEVMNTSVNPFLLLPLSHPLPLLPALISLTLSQRDYTAQSAGEPHNFLVTDSQTVRVCGAQGGLHSSGAIFVLTHRAMWRLAQDCLSISNE